MNFYIKNLICIVSISILIGGCSSNQQNFTGWLNSNKELEIEEIEADSVFTEAYRIFIPQYLDHDNPDAGTFMQQLIVSHINKDAPVVIDLEGYEIRDRTMELTHILNSNQIEVEHRFFGKSRPDSINWKYMTIKQAAADHHRIIEFFKDYYEGKWVSTGISKGGQAVMYHKRFYPDDIDASVAYVAPLNFSDEDKRIYHFLEFVGDSDCRDRITAFQRKTLEERYDLIPMLRKEAEEEGLNYSIGIEKAFEYMVLEYSFAFWQWANSDCSEIPDTTATCNELYEHLSKNSPVDFFSDSDIERLEPFYYQAFTEIGFYAYQTDKFADLLEYSDGSNKVWHPKNFTEEFDSSAMQDINKWLQSNGDNMIYIYGEYDPWTASALESEGETNSLIMILDEGSHRTRIKHFDGEDKELILSTLEEWLDMNIQRGENLKYVL
jgi:hypothetical protein